MSPKAMKTPSKARPITPDEIRAASIEAAHHARTPAELVDFLGMLGLPGGRTTRIVTTLACGHLSTEGRRAMGVKGVVCGACSREKWGGR